MINFYLWFAKYIIAGIAITILDIYVRADNPLEVMQNILSNWVYAQEVMRGDVQRYVLCLVTIVGACRILCNQKLSAFLKVEYERNGSLLTTIKHLFQKQWDCPLFSVKTWPFYVFFVYNYCVGMNLYRGGFDYLFIHPLMYAITSTPFFLWCYWIKANSKRLNAGEIEGGIASPQGKGQ